MAALSLFLSNSTKKIINEDIEEQAKIYAKKHKLELALVRAIIRKESDGIYAAIRYEPHLRKAKWYTRHIPERFKNDRYAYCSMGVMQVLYGIAKASGFMGQPFALMTPANSIDCGCRELRNLIKRYYYLDKVISSYNQGSPKMTKNKAGKKIFKNQCYVNKVIKFYREYGGRN